MPVAVTPFALRAAISAEKFALISVAVGAVPPCVCVVRRPSFSLRVEINNLRRIERSSPARRRKIEHVGRRWDWHQDIPSVDLMRPLLAWITFRIACSPARVDAP